MSKHVYNFCAGPCILPKEVFQQCRDEMMDWNGTGLSPIEISHRSPQFTKVTTQCRNDLRTFLEVPDTHEIILQQGGASMQYAAIIKNLLRYKENGESRGANYLNTGFWSNGCLDQAKIMFDRVQPTEMATGKSTNYKTIPPVSEWKIEKDASYTHYCQNETVHGFQIPDGAFPFNKFGDMPICCDMSSDIGSRHIDWSKYGMVYAGAQKNLGAAGVVVIIVRKDLLGKQHSDTPYLFNWNLQAKAMGGYWNTPATYPVYITGLNVAHMIKQGGLNHYIKLADQRGSMIYNYIDSSNGFYINQVDKRFRSKINVPLRIRADKGENDKTYTALELKFIKEAADNGFMQLKGHVNNPGIRVSMYNAMPVEGVVQLIKFMAQFKEKNETVKARM